MQRLAMKVDKIQSFAGFELTPDIWHRQPPDLRLYHPRSGVWTYMIIGNYHVDCPHGEIFIRTFPYWLHIGNLGCIYVPRREFIILSSSHLFQTAFQRATGLQMSIGRSRRWRHLFKNLYTLRLHFKTNHFVVLGLSPSGHRFRLRDSLCVIACQWPAVP